MTITPELIVAIGTALAAIISAFYARRTATQLPAIHTLVNSQYGNSLLINKVSANLLAEKEPDNEVFGQLAKAADAAYAEHLGKPVE